MSESTIVQEQTNDYTTYKNQIVPKAQVIKDTFIDLCGNKTKVS